MCACNCVVSTQMEVCFAFFLTNAIIPVYGCNKIDSRCFGNFIHALLRYTLSLQVHLRA